MLTFECFKNLFKILSAPIVNSDLFYILPLFCIQVFSAVQVHFAFLTGAGACVWRSPTCANQSGVYSQCRTKAIYLSTRVAWPPFTESRLPLWGQIQGPVLCTYRCAISSPSMQCQGVRYTMFAGLSHKYRFWQSACEKRASARAWVKQSDSLWFSHLPSASTRLVKVRLGSREHMIHWPMASFFGSCGFLVWNVQSQWAWEEKDICNVNYRGERCDWTKTFMQLLLMLLADD